MRGYSPYASDKATGYAAPLIFDRIYMIYIMGQDTSDCTSEVPDR
jgi:hypothetical protein